MFDNLIETNPRARRGAAGALVSLLLHGSMIGLAVAATASASDRAPEEEPEQVEFVEAPVPEAPPAPEREPAPAPPAAVAAPPLQRGFTLVQPPLHIPDVIPDVDLSKAPIDERAFAGIGRPGGAPDGIGDVLAAPAVDVATAYPGTQVDRPVAPLPGRGAPAYPALLRSRGVTGQVVAQFVVDTTGRVEPGSFEVIESSHELFTAAVERALPEMRFVPAELAGRRVRQLVRQPFVFDIR